MPDLKGRAHKLFAAWEEHDLDRLLAGLTPDAVWAICMPCGRFDLLEL